MFKRIQNKGTGRTVTGCCFSVGAQCAEPDIKLPAREAKKMLKELQEKLNLLKSRFAEMRASL